MDLGKLSKLSQRRECKECGAVFETDEEGAALQKFSDHLTVHQPTAEQWAEAYEKIQKGKARQSQREDIEGQHTQRVVDAGNAGEGDKWKRLTGQDWRNRRR